MNLISIEARSVQQGVKHFHHIYNFFFFFYFVVSQIKLCGNSAGATEWFVSNHDK